MAGQGSARVILNEIDLSQVRNPQQLPQGVPAAVVGPARKGPAFVPQTFANMQQFNEIFGNMLEKSKESNSNILAPLAINEWMKSAQAGTYVRILGVGNGKPSSGGGRVEEAGFTVGNKLVQKQEGDLGKTADNPYANITDSEDAIALGRTHFLGCFMKETADNTTLKDAGIDTTTEAQPVIRGVLMTPQGVRPALDVNASLNDFADSIAAKDHIRSVAHGKLFGSATNGTSLVGYVVGEVIDQGFKLILNGYSNTQNPAVLSCSFDPSSPAYFAKVLNTDPTKIEELGHYLYAYWDIDKSVAIPSNAGLKHADADLAGNYANMIGFLVAGAAGRDASADGKPNYEDFSSRFRTAKTPWITSQRYGGESKRLFRLHALDDGEVSNGLFRLLVSNLAYAGENKFGSFDLVLERLESNPVSGSVIVAWKNLSLDPNSKNFIARVIGDKHAYFDFERDESKQRLVTDGSFEIKNKFVRVELSDDMLNGEISVDALPCGFEGHDYLFTKSTGNFVEIDVANDKKIFTDANNTPLGILSNAMVPPVEYVKSISRKVGSTKEADDDLAWGVKFAKRKNKDSELRELIEEEFNSSIKSYAKYFPHFGSVPVLRSHEDDISFQNAEFNLENIEVRDVNASSELLSFDNAEYRRNGVASSDDAANKRFLKISTDGFAKNSRYLKFRCMFQGGFDGVNIFDDEKSKFTGTASLRENYDETSSNKKTGPTVNAYMKAVDVLSDKSAAEFQVLAIPGQRASVITDHAMKSCEERFDALYIMDIEEVDALGVVIEDALVKPHVRNTISKFEVRLLDSSFGAAYFPNVTVPRPSDNALVVVPPSVALLGVLSRNDAISAPWFAPAGLNRGAVVGSRGVSVQMNRDLLDELYDVDVNPLYEPAGRPGEVYVFGQKTLLQGESALDRINVRRLLIDLRRKVKKIGEQLLFEPNRESTLANFSRLVEPIMQDAQRRQGVTRYKVQIDSSTTTQNDVENNTIRGKIYLQPTKSIEFISLDFVVTNTL